MEKEKLFKTMSRAGSTSLVLGIVTIVIGVITGILMIVHGALLLRGKNQITF
ncbi:MAG: hypothetical protein IIZ39_10850 [Blautia sp.]|nr:hypothetical protein [Blautia sp.]